MLLCELFSGKINTKNQNDLRGFGTILLFGSVWFLGH